MEDARTDAGNVPANEASLTFRLDLSANELRLVRTALAMLEDTLGHEEADELAEVQAILRRLPRLPDSD